MSSNPRITLNSGRFAGDYTDGQMDGQTGSFYTVFSKTCTSEGLSSTAIPQEQQLVCCRQRSADKTVLNETKRQRNIG